MKPVLEGICMRLHQSGLGRFNTENPTVFIGHQPPEPDSCIAVYYRSGERPSVRPPYEVRKVQVLVRGGRNVTEAMDMAEAVYRELHGLSYTTLPNGQDVILIRASGNPVWLGQDEKRRHEFSIEFECHVRNTARI